MSSHFKYEIDERNLRLQLKENELSFSEDAWHKFESYTNTQKNSANDAIIKRINVQLNRNLILPAVFGVVIILFSLLLFNFINIKNPKTASTEAATQANTVVETAEIKTPATPPKQAAVVPAKEDSITTSETTNVVEAEVEKPEAVKEIEKPKVEEPSRPGVIEKPKLKRNEEELSTASTLNSDSNTTNQTVSTPAEPVKKKRRKREMIVTEPTQEEADQLPPPVNTSEETPQ